MGLFNDISWISELSRRAFAILCDAGIKGVVLLLIAGSAVLIVRRTAASRRHLIWTLAFASLLFLPLVSLMLPRWQLPILPREITTIIESGPAPEKTISPVKPEAAFFPMNAQFEIERTEIPVMSSEFPINKELPDKEIHPSSPPLSWTFWVVTGWLIISLCILSPFLVGIVMIRKATGKARPLSEDTWRAMVRDLAASLGLKRRVRVLRSDKSVMPMTWGIFRPVILLPKEADTWTEEKRRIVILHELAHVKRLDCLTQSIARVAFSLYWFNPLTWLARRFIRIERERACDDLVVNAGSRPSDYANHLLEIARTLRKRSFAAAAAVTMLWPSHLEKRLRAILDATRSRHGLSRWIVAVTLLFTVSILLPLGAIELTPQQDTEDKSSSVTSLSVSLLGEQIFTPRPKWISKTSPASEQYGHRSETGTAAFMVEDPNRSMKWVGRLDPPIDTREYPFLIFQYRAQGLSENKYPLDEGENQYVVRLRYNRAEGWGGFEAIVPEEIVTDGESHTIYVNLADFQPGVPITEVAIQVCSGEEGDAVLEIEKFEFTSSAPSSQVAELDEEIPGDVQLTSVEDFEHRGKITGVVMSAATGEPIGGAYVGIGDFWDSGGSNHARHREQGLMANATTDEDGRFVLDDVAFFDAHTFFVTHPEHVRHDRRIALLEDNPEIDLKVNLKPAAGINVAVVDDGGKPIQAFFSVRLEALNGRRFISPEKDRHLSAFASSVWQAYSPGSFSFTELDEGEYSIDVIQLAFPNRDEAREGWTLMPLDADSTTYYGGISRIKVAPGEIKDFKVKPANNNTRVTISIPENKFVKQVPTLLLISRNPGLLLWNDGEAHGPEDPRTGRLMDSALFYGMAPEKEKSITVNNLPPGNYSVFGGPVFFPGGVQLSLSQGDDKKIVIPSVEAPETKRTSFPRWILRTKVTLEAKDYTLAQLCELLTQAKNSSPAFKPDPSIQNKVVRLVLGEMEIWDVLESIYLDKGWVLKEEGNDTLVFLPGGKSEGKVKTSPPFSSKSRPKDSLIVTVVDNDGTPVPKALVQITGSPDNKKGRKSTNADREGVAGFRAAPPDTYTVSACLMPKESLARKQDSAIPIFGPETVVVKEGKQTRMTLRPKHTGVVVASPVAPSDRTDEVWGMLVLCSKMDSQNPFMWKEVLGATWYSAGHRYRFENVPEGSFWIVALEEKQDGAYGKEQVIVEEGKVTDAALQLRRFDPKTMKPVSTEVKTETPSPAPRPTSPLQSKIDNAKAGDVIDVPAGKHSGPLRIEKPLTLRGESAKTTVIELLDNEPTILIRETKGVTLENLTVRWAPKSSNVRIAEPAAIVVRDSEATIRGCRLEPVDWPKKTPYGMMAAGRSKAAFVEGSATGFAYTLIFLEGASGVVSDSFLEGAGHSVVTLHEDSHVKIHHNILANCGYHAVRNTGGIMDMTDNLVIGSIRAGAYLGNKPAHGRIANNLFLRNQGAIWAYANSDVLLENNIFGHSQNVALGIRDTCLLKLERNSFVQNPIGIQRYYNKEKGPGGKGAQLKLNHFWKNDWDFIDFESEPPALTGDPLFADPDNGDYAPRPGSALLDEKGELIAGLSNPEPIRKLWSVWKEKSTEIPSSGVIAESEATNKKSAQPSEGENDSQKKVNYLGQKDFPRIVELDPVNGASDVDPAREYITVTFDRPMRNGYSWVDKGKRPKLERIEWINDRQCRAFVDLEPGKEYGVWLNFGPNTSKFRSREGISSDRFYWKFHTASEKSEKRSIR